MNIRQVQYFTAVYEEGGFRKAAQRENCTQSGLSQQIRKLEERLGVSLFERTSQGVSPTVAGSEYYTLCIPILRSVHEAEQKIAELQGSLSGTIRAGLIPSLTKGVLAQVLDAFVKEHPGIDFHLVEAYSQSLTEQVIANKLDFAIVPVMPETSVPGLHRRVLSIEKELLLSGPALGLTELEPVPLAELADLKLVLPSPANSRRPYLDSQIIKAGVVPSRIMNIDGMTGTLEFVAESDWVTILPVTNCINELGRGRMTLNPIVNPEIIFEFILIEPSHRPPPVAARLFIEKIETRLSEIRLEWQKVIRSSRKHNKR